MSNEVFLKFWILSNSTLHTFTVDSIKLYREFNRADDRFCLNKIKGYDFLKLKTTVTVKFW